MRVRWGIVIGVVMLVAACRDYQTVVKDEAATGPQPAMMTGQRLGSDELLAIYRAEAVRLGVEPSLLRRQPPRYDHDLDWGFSKMATFEGPLKMFIDMHTGEIRALWVEAARAKYPDSDEGRYKSKLPMRDAERIARKHLAAIRVHLERYLPREPDRLVLRKLRFWSGDNSWRALFEKTYHGYPVDGYVSVDFLDDGTFLSFDSALQLVDCPVEVGVAPDMARKTAREAERKVAQLYGAAGEIGRECAYNKWSSPPSWVYKEGATLEVLGTNPILEGPKAYGEFFDNPRATRYRLVYVFWFEMGSAEEEEALRKVCIYIDAATGKCVGGEPPL